MIRQRPYSNGNTKNFIVNHWINNNHKRLLHCFFVLLFICSYGFFSAFILFFCLFFFLCVCVCSFLLKIAVFSYSAIVFDIDGKSITIHRAILNGNTIHFQNDRKKKLVVANKDEDGTDDDKNNTNTHKYVRVYYYNLREKVSILFMEIYSVEFEQLRDKDKRKFRNVNTTNSFYSVWNYTALIIAGFFPSIYFNTNVQLSFVGKVTGATGVAGVFLSFQFLSMGKSQPVQMIIHYHFDCWISIRMNSKNEQFSTKKRNFGK